MPRKLNNRGKEQGPSRHPQVRVGVIITKDDRVLLMQHVPSHGDGTWTTVSGYLAYQESPQDCAIREAREEVGVIITDVTFLAITNDIFADIHSITIWMAGRYLSDPPTQRPGQEISALDWFPWDALPEPLFMPFEHLLTGHCYPALWDFSGGDGERRSSAPDSDR